MHETCSLALIAMPLGNGHPSKLTLTHSPLNLQNSSVVNKEKHHGGGGACMFLAAQFSFFCICSIL